MQTFVSGLAAQAARFCVPIELIMVDWNPPPEKAGLAEALSWPSTKWVESRVIQVPAELHRRYKHAEALPLYQMIAKNVGIRRSRGEFVLATNIDLLFSDELFNFLAGRTLMTGKMYRVDRWDADRNVPLEATIDEQLAYCATHLLRINGRGETFPVSATGARIIDPAHITVPADLNQLPIEQGFVTLRRGFYQLERDSGEPYRWASSRIAVDVTAEGPGREVCFDIDPTVELGPVNLHFCVEKRESIVTISQRSVVRLQGDFPVGTKLLVEVNVVNRDQRKTLLADPRDLGFRVYSIRCAAPFSADGRPKSGLTVSVAPKPGATVLQRIRRLWKLWRANSPGMRLMFPVPKALILFLKPRFEKNGLSIAITRETTKRSPPNKLKCFRTPHWDNSYNVRSGTAYLHTNACGDFTLMSREDWLDLRGYPEWDLYSMNIDSALCISAARAGIEEVFLTARVYHIEHSTGSGYSPEGEQALWDRLRKKGIDWIDHQEIYDWDRQLRRLGSTMIFNRSDWGLIRHDLPDEIVLGTGVDTEAPVAPQ